MEVRNAFSDFETMSMDTALFCRDGTKTIQSQKDEADINYIVKQFGVTGQLPNGVKAPVYSDFDDIFDFRSAQDAIIKAQASFMAMPANVRSRFFNDPQVFVEFCSDKQNIGELRKMGLAPPEVSKEENSANVKDSGADNKV